MTTGSICILAGILSFLIGAAITWLVMNGRQAALRARLDVLSSETEKCARLEAECSRLLVENTALRTEREATREKMMWMEKAEEKLREAFDSLASRALKENAAIFMDQSRTQLESLHSLIKGDWTSQKEEMRGLVVPLEKDLEKLDKQVRDMEEKREGAYRSLETHIVNLARAQGDLQNATLTLSQALKSSTVRGRWGEVQLRRIAEMAGMLEHVDFSEQATADAGSGRPDMIVRMPEKGIIPVDSKAPMNAYLSATEARNEEDRKRFVMEHSRALRMHVKSLAQKAYWSQFDVSPDFVVMLVPYESGLGAAFAADPGLLEFALENRVIIVSPSTLLALLKVIALGWMQLRIAKNARSIAEQGKELYTRFRTYIGHFADVGAKLNSTVQSYNRAAGSMETRVLPAARKLREMGAGTEEIPDVPGIEVQPRVPADIEGE